MKKDNPFDEGVTEGNLQQREFIGQRKLSYESRGETRAWEVGRHYNKVQRIEFCQGWMSIWQEEREAAEKQASIAYQAAMEEAKKQYRQ